jgi:hypothetical protein
MIDSNTLINFFLYLVVQDGKQLKTPVIRALPPSELAKQIDFILPEAGLGLEGMKKA